MSSQLLQATMSMFEKVSPGLSPLLYMPCKLCRMVYMLLSVPLYFSVGADELQQWR